MVDRRLILFYIFVPFVMIGVGGSSYVYENHDPIHFRVESVELVDIDNKPDITVFTFETVSQVWNERYQNQRISHAEGCRVQTGIISTVSRFQMLNQPICSSLLPQTSTLIYPGLNNFSSQVILQLPGNFDTLPSGNYTFITYPETTDTSGWYTYQVFDDGSTEEIIRVPGNWGEMSVLNTPTFWYLPSYGMLGLIIFAQIQHFYNRRYKSSGLYLIE